MATTHQLITSTTVGSGGAATVSFSSIPQTYTDLKVLVSCGTSWSSDTNNQFWMQFNGDTGSNYPHKIFSSNGTGTDWDGGTTTSVNPQTQTGAMTGNVFTSYEFYIPNYTSGSVAKIVSGDTTTENSGSTSYLTLGSYYWTSTSAITSIGFDVWRGDFLEGSTFYLYGIKNS